ncbi:oligosaccharide flippase family protein [Glaciecola sp. XM2]|uniref:oligosaccharide flippase family protein n=1 Tax=Glaciecola sp. XM2 TaxID=1914931 RepID=UPI001BDE15B0|nr:oligosaccharide flippase family protein [Glaciecola sp. XM2]MBT1452434.1 oligosaccharide flippase family protein [Glaciecola sp. XM2]
MSVASSRIAKLFWVFFEKIGIVGLSIISFFIYAFYLTPAELGIGVLLLAIVELCSILLVVTTESAMIRQKHITQNQDGTAFWFLMLLSALLSCAVFVAYYLFIVSSQTLFFAALIAVCYIPLQSMSRVHIVHMRRRKAFRKLAVITLISKLIGMALGISLALNAFGEFVLVVQAVSMSLVTMLIILATEKRRFPFALERDWLKQQIAVGLPVTLKSLNTNIYNKGMVLLIELTLGTAAVGFYNFANRLVELPRAAIENALMGYAHTVFSNRNNSGSDIGVLFVKCTNVSTIVVLPVFVGLSLVGPDLITLLFGDKWNDSIPLFIAIALLTSINILFMFLPSLLIAYAKGAFGLKGQAFASVVALLVFYVLVDEYQLYAIIYALLIRVVLYFLVNLNACLRAANISLMVFIQGVYKQIVACCIMWAVTSAFTKVISIDVLTYHIAAQICVAVITYTVVIFALNPRVLRQFKEILTQA